MAVQRPVKATVASSSLALGAGRYSMRYTVRKKYWTVLKEYPALEFSSYEPVGSEEDIWYNKVQLVGTRCIYCKLSVFAGDGNYCLREECLTIRSFKGEKSPREDRSFFIAEQREDGVNADAGV